MDRIKLYNCDNLELMAKMEDESVDVILTDPPYLYLKNQKLDKAFDEKKFFKECYRVLTKNGMLVYFGRGESFYRWGYLNSELVFTKENEVKYSFEVLGSEIKKRNILNFKEEIIWNKSHNTSPLLPMSRIHETISVFAKGKGKINKVKVPYLEMKSHDLDSVIGDVKRMRGILKNPKSLQAVQSFLENNVRDESDSWNKNMLSISSNITKEQREVSVARSLKDGLNEKSIIRTDLIENLTSKGVSVRKGLTEGNRCVNVVQSVCFGLNEKSIIRTDQKDSDTFTKFGVNTDMRKSGDRCADVTQSICFGLNEKSIIKQVRDHYSAIHPTQKPVRLLERLLALVIPQDKDPNDIVVLDPFGGSFSTMEAVHNMGMQGISCEIDKGYFEDGKKRISNLNSKLF